MDGIIKASGKILGWALVLSLLFSLWVAHTTAGGFSFSSIGDGVETTLKLLMLIEGPRTALPSASPGTIVLAWIICVIGWLFLPLLVGMLVDGAMQRAEAELEARLTLRHILADMGIPSAKLDEANKKAVEAVLKSVSN